MGGRWQQRDDHGIKYGQLGTRIIGVFLVALGLFFLVSEQLSFDVGRHGWPLFIIVPGALLFLMGLAISHEGGLGAAIPGGIITTVGLLLFVQESTDTYASWAYAWALVTPGSVGVTLTLWGLIHRRWDLFDAGVQAAAAGFGLFVVLGLFFENVLGLDGAHGSVLRNTLPVMAVGLGVLVVIWNLLPRRSRSDLPASDVWRPVDEPIPPAPPTPPVPPAG
ncbi:MAG: hypothetical protein ABSB75_08965 [Candidatus Limnocylindrales bacterium]